MAQNILKSFNLNFHPSGEEPTEPGDYLLYNQCDGYHVVEAWFDDGEFIGFWEFAASSPLPERFYRAWAKLPDTLTDLYPIFSTEAMQPKPD